MKGFLPQIIRQAPDPERVRLGLLVSEDLDYFADHFPEWAILPGVVLVNWAVLFGQRFFTLSGAFSALEKVKFQKPVRPGTLLELELLHEISHNRLVFSYDSAAGRHASGRIHFAEPPQYTLARGAGGRP